LALCARLSSRGFEVFRELVANRGLQLAPTLRHGWLAMVDRPPKQRKSFKPQQ
jgi:putative transposase